MPTTAGIYPERFSGYLAFAENRKLAIIILGLFMVIGFGLRVTQLGTESLGEDELNKLETVSEYRENGLSGKNGEHPFLMKGLQTVSVAASEKWNGYTTDDHHVSPEAALRFPIALFGTFTILLLFLFASELFGRSIGLVSAILWAVEPAAIGFDRIAKEDSLVLFFFLLTGLFWIKGQSAAERGKSDWTWYAWAAAASFAGLMASKYYPHLLAIFGAYYIIFVRIPEHKWDMGKMRWLKFFVVMGTAFLILNPTIMLPETWREMLKFSSESRIGHDSYEYMGTLYRNQMTAWLSGVPWTFYYVFIAVKTSLPTLIFFLIGLPIIIQRRFGDGRFFLFFWAFMWFVPFTVLGGKFTRYFTIAEPLILITAAAGFCVTAKWLSGKLTGGIRAAAILHTVLLIGLAAVPLINSLTAVPHYRMFTNSIGGGAAGTYFPHDEFYDAAAGAAVAAIAARTQEPAVVACETPALLEYYAERLGRTDLSFVSLSNTEAVAALKPNDLIVLTMGRRYFSNTAYQEYLEGTAKPVEVIDILDVPAVKIFQLDDALLAGIRGVD